MAENEEYETIELEYSEDDILYYLEDEDGVEVGFVLADEDGNEVEYFYEGFDEDDYEIVDEPASEPEQKPEPPAQKKTPKTKKPVKPEEPKDKSYLGKLVAIAGAEAGKARDKYAPKLEAVQEKAGKTLDKAQATATEQAGKAAKAAKAKAKEVKDEYDLGFTREDISETTSDLNAIAHEGAEVAGELKAAYDDIMDSFSFLKKKH